MDYGALVSDAVRYSKAALIGKPLTWLVFIVCALPFALINFLYDPKTLVSATGEFRWETLPLTQIALLCIVGLLLSVCPLRLYGQDLPRDSPAAHLRFVWRALS